MSTTTAFDPATRPAPVCPPGCPVDHTSEREDPSEEWYFHQVELLRVQSAGARMPEQRVGVDLVQCFDPELDDDIAGVECIVNRDKNLTAAEARTLAAALNKAADIADTWNRG